MHFPIRLAPLLALGGLALGCGPSGTGSGNNNTQPDAFVFPDTRPHPDGQACEDRCTGGARQCVTGGYQECGDFDSDPCTEWGPVVPCPTDERCVDGSCSAACTDACTEGSVRCNAAGDAAQPCELNTGTGCLEWGTEVPCDTGETCSGGQCSTECADECATGSRQCQNDGYQVCGDFDSDACTDWGPVTTCALGETCSNGFCSVACTNECAQGARQCVGSGGYQVCGDFDSDVCTEWGPTVPCQTATACANGQCVDPLDCTDECATQGQTQCTTGNDGYQVCDFNSADACLHWGSPITCDTASGETCVSGACEVSCGCDFNPSVCEPQDPNTTIPCTCDPDCDTLSPCAADSHCDTWCPAGTDPDCACTCDYNEYCEAAAVDSSDTCACDPDCELHEAACSDDGHCDTWCPQGADPDCGVDACRQRWMNVGWRNADELWLRGAFTDPDPDEGAPWVLFSPDLASGEGEIWVELAEESSLCVDQILIDAWGYDDSIFGDGAEVYLYNWTELRWDLLSENFDLVEAWVSNYVSLFVEDYLLCASGARAKCYINAKIGASAWDNTHVWDVYVDVLMVP